MTRLALIFLLCFPLNGCTYFPIGTGNRVHICGNIVDENLNPILDTLSLMVSIARPLMNASGRVVHNTYNSQITDSKFCVDGNFVMSLTAFIRGKNIFRSYISVHYQGITKKNFKWVVERNVNVGDKPDLMGLGISIDTAKASSGFSVTRSNVSFSDTKSVDGKFRMNWLADLFKMSGNAVPSQNIDSLFNQWDLLFPGTIEKKKWNGYDNTWIITKPKILLDYTMIQKADSLLFVPGPLVKTKFIPATLDTPICNFGRMPAPPALGNSAWQDTLLVAIGDSVVTDGFYVYFPWANRWGKAILYPKVIRTGSKIEVNVTHVFAEAGDTKPFLFWIGPSEKYSERRKCLTKVESMIAGEYNTVFDRVE